MRNILIFFAIASFFTGCREYPEVIEIPPVKIAVSPGPEDIALDERNTYPRIIVSCASRRPEYGEQFGFDELNLLNDAVRQLPIEGLPDGQVLGPHGIDIAYRDGKTWLYVVNHELDYVSSILILELQADKLVFSERLTTPLLVSPNDLCVDAEGRLFVSNDRSGPNLIEENLNHPFGANIIMYDGSWHTVATHLAYANGVFSLENKVYVACTRENYMYQYDIDGDTMVNKTNFANALLGQDNITRFEDKLYVAAHTNLIQFVLHSASAASISPFAIFEVDIASGEKKMKYSNDGRLISGVSAAIRYENKLYLAQIFEPFLLKVTLGDE